MRFKFICILVVIFFTTNTFADSTITLHPFPEEKYPIGADTEISIPEGFYSSLDSLLYSYYVRKARKGNCKGGDNIEYPDSIYMERLQELPYVIEMPYNKIVGSLINLYTVRRRAQVEYMMGLGRYYFPMFEDVLNKYDIPIELKYLPIIESALNITAISRAGAAGLWQFMPSTGKIYGLEVNSLVDERFDPLKSTYAAARFLKDLYSIYQDWHLAIAAYNCGPGNVNKAIRRSGGKKDYWAIYPYLPQETRGYVPIFIAANYVMNYYQYHNLCPAQVEMPAYTDTIRVKERMHLSQVAEVLTIPLDELKSLNPQYRRNIIPGNAGIYYLRLPHQYTAHFIEQKDSILAHRADELVNTMRSQVEPETFDSSTENHRTLVHRVRSGETLSSIAYRYGVAVNNIKRWNGLKSSKIIIGQRLSIRK
jgi:membrane-bound lytic murein transglycosylase D